MAEWFNTLALIVNRRHSKPHRVSWYRFSFTSQININIWCLIFAAYPDILMDMVARMGPKVGLVQGLPFCTDRKGFPAVLDKVCTKLSLMDWIFQWGFPPVDFSCKKFNYLKLRMCTEFVVDGHI